jgi:fibronectin-binding autotransporter adhesin
VSLLSWAADYQVTNTNSGDVSGSLGSAITSANANLTTSDTVTFSSLFNTAQTISLSASEPASAKTTGTLTLDPTSTLTLSSFVYTALGVSGGTFDVGNVSVQGSNSYDGIDVTGGTMNLSNSNILDGVLISTGTLSVSNSTLSGPVNLSGGTLQTVTGISAPAEVNVTNAGTISVSTGQTSTFTNVGTSGAPASTLLTFTGGGTVVLTGLNPSAPYTDVTGGTTLSVSSYQNTYESTVTLSGGTLLTTASVNFFGSTALTGSGGTINLSGASNTTTTDGVSGTGGLTVTGSGTLEMPGTNGFTGGLTIQGGATVVTDRDYELGATSGSITLNGGTLATSDGLQTSRNIALGASGGTVTVGINGETSLTGTISGAGGLTINGAGESSNSVVSLATGNSYRGGTTVNGATLEIADDSSLGPLLVGSLTLNAAILETPNSYTTSRTINLGSGGAEIEGGFASTATFAFQSQITGTGSLTLSGSSATFTFSSRHNNYSGGTTVEGGSTLILTNGTGVASGSATGSGTLYVNGATLAGQGMVNASSFTLNNAQLVVGTGYDPTSQMNLTGASASAIQSVTLEFNLGVGTYQGESNELNLGSTSVTFTSSEIAFSLMGGANLLPGSTYTLITTNGPIDPTAYGLTVNAEGQITGGLSIDGSSAGNGSYLYISGDDIDVMVVPEPKTWGLLGLGFSLVAATRFKRKSSRV